jgi:hypothetical protein
MGWNTTTMPKEFRDADSVAMKEVEKAIINAVIPFRERHMPAWLVAIALMRCTRTVFRLVRKNDQKELKPVMIAFFEGKVNPPGEPGLIWTPDQVM